eukprot:RCo050024
MHGEVRDDLRRRRARRTGQTLGAHGELELWNPQPCCGGADGLGEPPHPLPLRLKPWGRRAALADPVRHPCRASLGPSTPGSAGAGGGEAAVAAAKRHHRPRAGVSLLGHHEARDLDVWAHGGVDEAANLHHLLRLLLHHRAGLGHELTDGQGANREPQRNLRGGERNAAQPLVPLQAGSLHEGPGHLHGEDLEADDDSSDHQEHLGLSPDPAEAVELSVNLPCVELVEDLHPDERVEDDRAVLRTLAAESSVPLSKRGAIHRGAVLALEPDVPLVQQQHHHGELEQRVAQNEAPHPGRNQGPAAVDGLAAEVGLRG